MAKDRIRVQVSATEVPHFKRLVEFLAAVDRHADGQCDVALQELVRECRIDLLHLLRGDGDGGEDIGHV